VDSFVFRGEARVQLDLSRRSWSGRFVTGAHHLQRPGRLTTSASETIFAHGGPPAVVDTEVVHDGYRVGERSANRRHDEGAGWPPIASVAT